MGKHFPGSGEGETLTLTSLGSRAWERLGMNTLGISQLSLGPWGSQSPREMWTIQEMLTMTSP